MCVRTRMGGRDQLDKSGALSWSGWKGEWSGGAVLYGTACKYLYKYCASVRTVIMGLDGWMGRVGTMCGSAGGEHDPDRSQR